MGYPIIPDTKFQGNDCDLAFTPGYTPKFVIIAINGIKVGRLGVELGYKAPNGIYVAQQQYLAPCTWIWERGDNVPGPHGIYSCEPFPQPVANAIELHYEPIFTEVWLTAYRYELAFYVNDPNTPSYSWANGMSDENYEFYGGHGSAWAFGTGYGTFSILDIAKKFGFTGEDHARAEPYSVAVGEAGLRIARRADRTRIYIRQERN